MKTSVALCTFNGEKYIKKQINSILNQSILVDEIIICDDKSNDNTIQIIEEIKKFSLVPIDININEKNLGYIKNFEKAINLCNNELIFLSDQDDIWNFFKVEKIMEIFLNKKNVGLVFSNARIINDNGNDTDKDIWSQYRFTQNELKKLSTKDAYKYLIKKNYVTGATVAFKKDLVSSIGSIPKNFIHDHYIALIISMQKEIYPINDCLIKYREHQHQQIGAKNTSRLYRLKEKKQLVQKEFNRVASFDYIYQKDFLTKEQLHELKKFQDFYYLRTKIKKMFFLLSIFYIIYNIKIYLGNNANFKNYISDIFDL